MSSIETIEFQRFYTSFQEDIKLFSISDVDGTTPENVFTDVAMSLLAEGGQTENCRVCYDEKVSRRGIEHKINGYALSENYETLDLFVSVFHGTNEVVSVSKPTAVKAFDRVLNFFKGTYLKSYAVEIEPASEIYDIANTIANVPELKENLTRINIFLLTDGQVKGTLPTTKSLSGCNLYYHIIDINYLFNLSQKSRIPIEIDFAKEGFEVPCIAAPSRNELYNSYLAIMPARALVHLYERYGSRLLEQNLRSFLEFRGNINKGIRKTLKEEPHMFLAFNNGISATAEDIEVSKSAQGGFVISRVEDLQIVNGGQTTAAIYHSIKTPKYKVPVDLDAVFVQVKLSVVRSKPRFSEIVSRIAVYSNTQNRVAISEHTANDPFHVELEKLSRGIFAAPPVGQTVQTQWFYERARGQYKNARLKEIGKKKQDAFDRRNPKKQMFTKGDLAKFVNVFSEIENDGKIVIGPHIVVLGNEKNYGAFINYNLVEKPDNGYFEDVIAKAILYRSAERIYGIKPNALGDLRYVTVPYALAYLFRETDGKLDFYKIWKNQSISDLLEDAIRNLMVKVERWIKKSAPGALYGEWAKKEKCWEDLKHEDFKMNLKHLLKKDLEDPKNPSVRVRISDNATQKAQIQEELERLRAIPLSIWANIAAWGRETGLLTPVEVIGALHIPPLLKRAGTVDPKTRKQGIIILNKVIKDAPEIIAEICKMEEESDLLVKTKEFVIWNRDHKRIGDDEHRFMASIASGRTTLTEKKTAKARAVLTRAQANGFEL